MKKFFKIALVWLLSWTWGIVQNFAGLVLFLILCWQPHKMYNGMVVTLFSKKENIGAAFTLGLFVFTDIPFNEYDSCIGSGHSDTLLAHHEAGHGIVQSLIFGPIQLLAFELVSVVWFWYRRISKNYIDYEACYAESTASAWGNKIIAWLNQ